MTLKEKYKDYFRVGAEVNLHTINTHKELIIKHFDSITCENETKFESLCPLPDKDTFESADAIATFAKENGILLRGHTFVWHNQTPEWVFKDADKELLLSRMKNHIQKVGKHYQDSMYCWDVVNEAIEDKTDLVLRDSQWRRIIGDDFMEYAFRYAKETLPNTPLYYNDYNEMNPVKREKIYSIVKQMKENGVPVDGIGMQCHINIYEPGVDELKAAIERYASLGVRLQFTEMDVSMFRFEDHTVLNAPSKELIQLQAKKYKEYFKVFREYHDVIDCVTLWGVADDATWLSNFPVRNRKNWPLLFDDNHEEKEAFYAIMDF
ncbi:MAG TPA: endo-1,4-beta-xylanase [Lachnospiraceae bacterium]|nr:endo-1,4-beta-xylanase [Lachnospiraceae bacterium]